MIILVVEDEAIPALLLRTALEEAGHEVLGPAMTVAESLELAARTRPDLALVNIRLRNGDDGRELARALKERWQVPLLFVSGQQTDAEQAKDAAEGYIGKPYQPWTVVESVEALRALLQGNQPRTMPPGLVLFGETE